MSDSSGGPEGWDVLGAKWRSADEPPRFTEVDLEEVRARSWAFARRIRWRNAREIAAGVLVMGTGIQIAVGADTSLREIGGVALALGALVVTGVIGFRGQNLVVPAIDAPTREALAHERSQLERQAHLLERVWAWYLSPFFPSIILLYADALLRSLGREGPARTLGVILTVVLFVATAGLFFAIGWLNIRAARALRARMSALGEIPPD